MPVTTHAMWTEAGVELVLFLPFFVQLIPVAGEGPPALFHPPIPMANDGPPTCLCSKIFSQNMVNSINTKIWEIPQVWENYGNCRNYEKKIEHSLHVSLDNMRRNKSHPSSPAPADANVHAQAGGFFHEKCDL